MTSGVKRALFWSLVAIIFFVCLFAVSMPVWVAGLLGFFIGGVFQAAFMKYDDEIKQYIKDNE